MEKLILILITIIGAFTGHYLGIVGYRIPKKKKILRMSMYCDKCHKKLKWYMNIPILSFLISKGKCNYCSYTMSYMYSFVEIIGAITFLCNYIVFDFSYQFFIATIITCALLVTIISDFLYYYISDRVIIISYIFILFITLYFNDYIYQFKMIITSIIAFIVLYIFKKIGNKLFKKESLGDGDIKLMTMISLALGPINSIITLFIASIYGIIFSLIVSKYKKDGIIPFGPFLLFSSLITLYLSGIIEPFISKFINF